MARLCFFYKLEGVDVLLREEGMPVFLFEHKVPGSLEMVFTSHEGKANFSENEQDIL